MRPVNLPLLLGRSVVGFIAMVCYFWALSQVPLATAAALLYTSPVLVGSYSIAAVFARN